jgi:hypothetical protein
MKFIRKYWVIILVLSLVIGGGIKIFHESFDLTPKTITEVVNDSLVTRTYYVREIQHPVLNLISDLMVSLSFALLISLVFIRSIEASDKEKFEKKLLDFQKETAKDAISSAFERLIDKDFFEIIKNDILNAKFQRKNLRWHYDIINSEESNYMRLTRTISYILENISPSEQVEHISLSTFSTSHCTTEAVAVKCKIDGENKFRDLLLQNHNVQGTLTTSNKSICVPGGKCAEIVLIFNQLFPRDYIYETHFLNQGAVGLELTVNMPHGYEFSINSNVLSSRTEKLVDENTKKVFRIKGAIYRGQGIEFMCFKQLNSEQSVALDSDSACAASCQ